MKQGVSGGSGNGTTPGGGGVHPTAIGTPNDVISGSGGQNNNNGSGGGDNKNNADGSGGGTDAASAASQNKSFLDGSFAGGWQSNADLPDRRRIIFSILEVIRQMRPDTNKISQK